VVKPTRVTNATRSLRFANGEMTQVDLADLADRRADPWTNGATMKAIVQDRYGSSGVLELGNLEEPAPRATRCWCGCGRPGSTPGSGTS
jgi:hypothetical protein